MSRTALCIGINNYPGTQMDLQGCVNDAADWSQVLTARGVAVTTLLDAAATKAAMVTALSALIAGGVAGDSLVITFSGHGTYQPDADGDEADGLDEALCPHDIQTRGEALVDDELRAIFAAGEPGVRVLLIADSCHSGTVSRAAPAEPEADAPRPRFLPMGNWLPAARVRPVSVVPGAVSPVRRHAAQATRRPAAVRLQGRPEQLQLRRENRRPLQRRLHLLRAQDPEIPAGRRDLRRLAHGDRCPSALGELSANPAHPRRQRGAAPARVRLTRRRPRPHLQKTRGAHS